MHSVVLDTNVSPRKRTLSRGMSEDESLRIIIKETDSSSRRLIRSDSRAGTLKRRSDSQQSDQDLSTGPPEMTELQASYDEVVQELRGLEVERETLLFQVDVLQDTLESVEELLAEAQREASQASLELEQEREAKRKLESMVCSLVQEMERLKEEMNKEPPGPVSTHGGGRDQVVETRQGHQMTNTPRREESSLSEARSIECRDRVSEDMRPSEDVEDDRRILLNLQRMVNKPLSHIPSLALDNPFSEDGILRRHFETADKDGREPSPDRNDSDSISAYEDASAETPEQDGLFPGEADTLEQPDDSEDKEKDSADNRKANGGEAQDAKNPENCVVS